MRVQIIILIILVAACQPSGDGVKEIVSPGSYKGRIPYTLTGDLMGGLAIEQIELVTDSLLLVIDSGSDPAISLYSLKDFTKIATTAKRGNGPFEFITPKFEGRSFREGDSLFIHVSDFNAHILYRLNISKLLGGEPNEFIKIEDIHSDIAPGWLEIFKINSKIYIGSSWTKSGRTFLWNLEAHTVNFIPNEPKLTVKISNDVLGQFYYGFSTYNEQTKTMVSAMQLFKRIDYFDSTGNIVKTVQFSDMPIKQPLLRTEGYPYPEGTYFHFSRISSDSKFIYVMCEDRRVENKRRPDLEYQLYVFDWQGKYRGRWELQRFNVGQFTVNEKAGKIYAVNYGPEMERYPLLVYDISEIVD